jgi:hypothetical protein
VLCIAESHLAANEFLKLTAFFPRPRAVISFLLIRRDLMFYILRFNSVPPPCPFSFTSALSDLSFAPQTSPRIVVLLLVIIFCYAVPFCLMFLLFLLLRSCLLGSSCRGHVVTVSFMTAYGIVSLFGHSCLLRLTLSPIYSDHSVLPRE